jgi:arylsulfatase A-like enzyme
MNVILFLPDQWRAEAIGHLGNPVVKTPHLDALASEGVSFSHCYTQNGVCTPSRCSLLTGWYPHVAGHRTMHHFVRRHEPNLLRNLRDAGYYVWWGGKNDMIPMADTELACDRRVHGKATKGPTAKRTTHDDPLYYSFYRGDVSEEPMHLDDDSVVDHAVAFLGEKHAKPFFMWINQGLPHPPYEVEREWLDLYPPDAVRRPIPPVTEGKPGILDAIRERAKLKSLGEEHFRRTLACYYAMCSRVDRNLGRVVDAVKRAGLWDDTAIIQTSDHGDFAGDYGMVEKTQNTFEDVLTRIPLVVRVPGCKPHAQPSEAMVESMDVFATVMELAGVEAGHTHFSRSLLPVARGERTTHREFACCEGGARVEELHTHESLAGHSKEHQYWPRVSLQNEHRDLHGKAVMLRTAQWKYVRRLYDTDELYDMRSDPDETRNLIDDLAHAEVVREMREKMLTWFLDTGDAVPFEWDKRSANEVIWTP